MILCMSIVPGYSGQPFMPEALRPDRGARALVEVPDPGRRRRRRGRTSAAVRAAGASLFVAGNAVFADPDPAAAYRRIAAAVGMSLDRALELAARPRESRIPNPTVGAVVVADGEIVGEGVTEALRRPPRRGRRARGGRRACARRDALRDDGAVRPSRHDAAVRRRDRRGRCRARRRRLPRPEPRRRRRARAAAPGRRRGRARRPLRGAATERGLADVDVARTPVRHVQGRADARRPGDRAGDALGDRRGVAAARARAAGRLGRRRRRDGHRARRCAPARRAGRRRSLRQPRRLAFGRGPLPAGLRARAALRRPLDEELARARRRRASSRSCSRAGRRSRRRSSRRTWSTSCSCSSRRRSPGDGPTVPRRPPGAAVAARAPVEHARSARTCSLEAYLREPRERSLRGMFTGIVREVGSVAAVDGWRRGRSARARGAGDGAARRRRRLGRGQRRLPHGRAVDGGAPRPSTPSRRRSRGRPSASSSVAPPSTSSRRSGPAIRWAVTSSRATSTASAGCSRSRPRARGSA